MGAKQYKEELPDGCPPLDAENVQNIVFYRLVKSHPPTEEDFISLKGQNPTKDYNSHECEARALSVFVELSGALEVLKLPTQKGKQITKLKLGSNSGKHKRTFTRQHHHSWWVYSSIDPLACCETVQMESVI